MHAMNINHHGSVCKGEGGGGGGGGSIFYPYSDLIKAFMTSLKLYTRRWEF